LCTPEPNALGIDRFTFDYDRATAGMKRLYPAMEPIQTWSAWRDR
jgi:hypothetical protein